jgi:hypothetical protein
MAFAKLGFLINPIDGGPHACADERCGIQDDDAKQLTSGRIAVREPETRHRGNLGRWRRVARETRLE